MIRFRVYCPYVGGDCKQESCALWVSRHSWKGKDSRGNEKMCNKPAHCSLNEEEARNSITHSEVPYIR